MQASLRKRCITFRRCLLLSIKLAYATTQKHAACKKWMATDPAKVSNHDWSMPHYGASLGSCDFLLPAVCQGLAYYCKPSLPAEIRDKLWTGQTAVPRPLLGLERHLSRHQCLHTTAKVKPLFWTLMPVTQPLVMYCPRQGKMVSEWWFICYSLSRQEKKKFATHCELLRYSVLRWPSTW